MYRNNKLFIYQGIESLQCAYVIVFFSVDRDFYSPTEPLNCIGFSTGINAILPPSIHSYTNTVSGLNC